MEKTLLETCSIPIEIIERLRDPATIKAAMLDPKNHNPDPVSAQYPLWGELSFASGYPGFVVLFSALERAGVVGPEYTHEYVLAMKESIENNSLYDLSLYNGVSGLCFALHQASFDFTRYQGLLDPLHEFLLEGIPSFYLKPIDHYFEKKEPVPSGIFDAIQGISGVGRYLLEFLSYPPFEEAAKKIATSLVALCKSIERENHLIPGWLLGPEDPLNWNKSPDKKGNFNLGLAHGIPGVLAFFSIALLHGLCVDGQKEAMGTIVDWLQKQAFVDQAAIHWPYSVSFETEVEEKKARVKSRDAWCYGVPGIARALYLAGKALNDTPLKTFSMQAFQGIFTRSPQEWNLPGPMLCHGISGLFFITLLMSREEDGAPLKKKVGELKNLLLTYFNPDSPYGYQDFEPTKKGGFALINKVGWLEGTTGVILALLSETHPEINWHLPLMLHE